MTMDRLTHRWVAMCLSAGMASIATAQWKNPADNPAAAPAVPQVQPPEPASGPIQFGPELPVPPKNLALKFTKGWTRTYWLGLDSREDKRDPKRPNESGELRLQQQLVLTISCVAASEGSESSFDVRIDEVKLDLRSQGASLYFDSTLAPSPLYNEETNKKLSEETPIKSAIKPLIGTSFTVIVDSKGNVVKVVGGQNFEAAQSNPLSSPVFGVSAVRVLLEPVFSPAHVPASAIGVGESWSRRDQVSLATGKVAISDDFRLQTLNDKSATISMEGKVVPEASTSTVRIVGSKRQALIDLDVSNGTLLGFQFQDDLRMSGKAVEDGRELTVLNVRRVKIETRDPASK